MHILAGGAALCFRRETSRALSRTAQAVVAGLVALLAVDSLSAHPHYLAYFNSIVPREAAYRQLVDSSLDWGQDLPGLKRWLDAHNAPGHQQQPVHLAYFGKGSPQYYGIEAIHINRGSEAATAYRPGLYCISATTLQAVYEAKPGRWNRQYEEQYQALRNAAEPDRRELEYFRYLRLLAYLRQREPDDHVGYSILIYRLTAADLIATFDGPPRELDAHPSIVLGGRR
jgi:hypothetical protein